MQLDESRTKLSAPQAAEANRAYNATLNEFLDPQNIRPNVVGLGVGMKWRNGEPTGEPALLALVSHKMPREELTEADLVPRNLAGMQTDVVEIGYPMAGNNAMTQQFPTAAHRAELTQPNGTVGYRLDEARETLEVDIQELARRRRPAQGGWSVGHPLITAGTIATCVYDLNAGGIPRRYYILSNNHVLANSNNASIGDHILQPGPYDGGVDPTDHIGYLSRFVPITFEPSVPRERHRNLVDAAIAEGQFHDLNREIYWIGYVRGWRPKQNIGVGDIVYKTGRTTNFTRGRIIATNATVDVNYGGGRVARFREQIITTNMSAGGDSGSLVVTFDENTNVPVAVGLLFAGSSSVTIINYIQHVRSLLGVEIAERVL